MPVQCLNDAQKSDLYQLFIEDVPKADIAKRYGVSLRTVGRVIEEIESQYDIDEDADIEVKTYSDEEVNEFEEENNDTCPNEEVEYFVVATKASITITKVAQEFVRQVTAVDGDENFDEVSNIVWENRGSQESLEKAYDLIDKPTFIEKYTNGMVTVVPEANRVYFTSGGQEYNLHGRLVPRLIDSLAKGKDDSEFKGLMEFTKRLINNPSNRSVNELYNFLEAADIKITKEGLVRCFKKVRSSYMDIHSNSMDNSPGKVVEINRNAVDENSDRTCSYGLHVCSKSYLPHFGSYAGDRILSVLVDPADFVAIPRDYYKVIDSNGTVEAKARVCKYFVESDITEELEDF